ncbi:MAG: hypothetical protein R6W48_02320 [Gaiellaceae bacterium]
MLEQLAAEVAANRPAAPNYGYPPWLRDKVAAATAEVIASGGSIHGVARRLGLNANTVRRWTDAPEPRPGFRPVMVAGAQPTRRYRLRTPSGYEAVELELSDLVALLRELA